jgi:riboflavin biosynthesis pyrimidine reductase
VHGSFLSRGLADLVYLFVAPKLLGSAGFSWTGELQVPSMGDARLARIRAVRRLGEDVLLEAVLHEPP